MKAIARISPAGIVTILAQTALQQPDQGLLLCPLAGLLERLLAAAEDGSPA